MTEFEIYDKKLKEKLSKVTNATARKNLFDIGYMSSSYILPEYYIAKGFTDMQLAPLNFANDKPKKTKAITIITPKGRMSWRRFSLLHPYSYWHLATEMTTEDNWAVLVTKLCEVKNIAVYSTPRIDTRVRPQGIGIQAWKRLNETDVLRGSNDYNFLVSTDIKNFYPSIYTHRIAWAIEGKEESRADRSELLFGNHLDRLFQNSREGQTNGIPVGCTTSDITAEIILGTIDIRLCAVLKEKGISYTGARYRDDYRFLCKSRSDSEVLLKVFSRLLQNEFDMLLNEDKTSIQDDVVVGSIRPWDLLLKESTIFSKLFENGTSKLDRDQIKTILLNTYSLQSQYPNSRISIQIISRLTKKLSKQKAFKLSWGDAEIVIALTRKLILLREDVTPQAMLFLDLIFGQLAYKRKVELMNEMHDQFLNSSDNEYQEVWLYRLCLHHTPKRLMKLFGKSDNPLINMLDPKSKPHWQYFESLNEISDVDKTELEKFTLVDQATLTASAGKPISPLAINIFPKY